MKATKKQLKIENPPVREAVIELRFANNSFFDFGKKDKDVFLKAKSALQERFEEVTEEHNDNLTFEFTSEEVKKDSIINGLICRNKSESTIFHLKQDRIFLSKFKPYQDFEDLFESMREFILLLDLGKKYITRSGLRYINEIDYNVDFNKLLKKKATNLDLGNEIKTNKLFTQNHYSTKENENLLVNFLIDTTQKKIILDVDVSSSVEYQVKEFSKANEVFQSLRVAKNDCFNSILKKDYYKINNGLK